MLGHKLVYPYKPLSGFFAIKLFGLCVLSSLATADESLQHLQVLVSHNVAQSGLMQNLAETFKATHPDIIIDISSADAQTVLEQARQGKAGLVITHRSPRERLFMDEGYGLNRTLIMYRQFALFAPPAEQADLSVTKDLRKLLRQLAERKPAFVVPDAASDSRDKLHELWSITGVQPNWPGYTVSTDSSEAILQKAASSGAYAFADMASYLSQRQTLSDTLLPLYHDHAALRLYYSAIVVNDHKFARLPQQAQARALLDFLVSDEGQSAIRRFAERHAAVGIFMPAAHLDTGLRARQARVELAASQRYLNLTSALTVLFGLVGIVATWFLLKGLKLQHATRLSKDRFALAVAGSSDGIWDWDIKHGNAYFSSRAKEILGLQKTHHHIADLMLVLKGIIHRQDGNRVISALHDYLNEDGDHIFSSEFRLNSILRHNEPVWVMMRGKLLRDKQGQPIRMSGSFTDITDSKMQKAAIEHQALHDLLTGLPNRVLLHDRLRQAVRLSDRNDHPFALLMMDLNRFKEVNDTLGHHVGDEVLEHVALRLKKILRKSDTVARLGGDEFAMLLTDANMTYANHVAEKVILSMKKVFELKGHNLYIGGSVGISVFPEHGRDAQTLVQHADVAMYVAKRNNSGVAIYDSTQDQHSVRRLSLVKDLHEAIENNGLTIFYQPKVDLQKKTVTGVEALLRWQHPQLGMISPVEMIEIAEQTGLIQPLTKWLLENAMPQLAKWQSMGLHLDLAVNLSIWNLQDSVLPTEIHEVLTRNGLEADRLELEITESAMIADMNMTVNVLDQLSRMGVKLAIDDYGTGFSSLSYLKKLAVDNLKIDKSFVLGMVGDSHDASIVRSTIELAHNIGLQVVAEGVEDSETLAQLASMGCEVAQGYYFSRPLPAEELPRWIKFSPWGFFISAETEQAGAENQLHNIPHYRAGKFLAKQVQ